MNWLKNYFSSAYISWRLVEWIIILGDLDNGIGFDSQKVNSGMGLQGMFERSQIINGQLKIDTTPNQGTRIQLTFNHQPISHD